MNLANCFTGNKDITDVKGTDLNSPTCTGAL